ncbi:probable serine/threonine-protein kinase DDB_G0281745 [Dysidea avara]|uniref:probable serine/threonine-protein kinase DDB_G0281745 n=1 Tax=Dysidea avara TaxID=196820 RepID=UPI00331C6140
MAAFLTSFTSNEVTRTGIEIGRGSYGRVLEVYVRGTLCAAKEIHSILLENRSSEELKSMKDSFFTECAKGIIHHPNVIQILGIHHPAQSQEIPLPWLIMEKMETNLTDFLSKQEKENVTFRLKLSILVDISQGLEFLHGQDIIHRDLSSNSILLTKQCVAKISDFGKAKIIERNWQKHSRMPGTLHFMPPEATSVDSHYDTPIDVFSLGCIACHVMSHQWPEPKNQVQQHTMIALTEVQRRDKYLQSFTHSLLRSLIELCLYHLACIVPSLATAKRG